MKTQLSCLTGKYNIIAGVLIIFLQLKQNGGQKFSQRECLLSVTLLESKTDPLGGLIHTEYDAVDGTLSCILFHFCFRVVVISCSLVWFAVFSCVSLIYLFLRFVVFYCVLLICCVFTFGSLL